MKLSVLGGGSWGTVLALLAASRHEHVVVWCRDAEHARAVERARSNERYLPGAKLPSNVCFTSDFEHAAAGAGIVIVALPTEAVRAVIRANAALLSPGTQFVSASKGIEKGTFCRVSQILEQELPAPMAARVAAVSGPNLAREMAAGKPTGAVVASAGEEAARSAQRALSTSAFRLYSSTDVVGVEYGGALKNIIAIGAGIVHGLGLGDNSMAALLTRGLAEMTRLGVRGGARPLTFNGLSGVGDLVATCASPLSRNHSVGYGISQGAPLEQVLARLGMVAEGVPTTQAVHAFASNQGVEMPITREIHAVLFESKDPRLAVADLMSRDLKSEEEFL